MRLTKRTGPRLGLIAIALAANLTPSLCVLATGQESDSGLEFEPIPVAVSVTADGLIRDQLESFITRGLREFSDVKVVAKDARFAVSVVAVKDALDSLSLSVVVEDRQSGWERLQLAYVVFMLDDRRRTEQDDIVRLILVPEGEAGEFFHGIDRFELGSDVITHMVLTRGSAIDPRDIAADIVAVVDSNALEPARKKGQEALDALEKYREEYSPSSE